MTTQRKGGRPTKLTPDNRERVLQAIRAGATIEAAAGAAGVDESTLYRWLRAGEGDDATEPYRQFRQDVYRARDELEVRVAAGSVLKAALGGYVVKRVTRRRPDGTVEEEEQVQPADGRVGLEMLARRFPDRWGRNRLEVTGAGGGPLQVEHSAVIASLAERLERELGGEDRRAIEGQVVADDS